MDALLQHGSWGWLWCRWSCSTISAPPSAGLVICDNQIALNAGWDDALLAAELAALRDEDFDLALTGFDADALADLLVDESGGGSGQTDDDAVPNVVETPITRLGDVWLPRRPGPDLCPWDCGSNDIHWRNMLIGNPFSGGAHVRQSESRRI